MRVSVAVPCAVKGHFTVAVVVVVVVVLIESVGFIVDLPLQIWSLRRCSRCW